MTNYSAIPQHLKSFPNWVAWRSEKRNGEKTKIPYNVETGTEAKSNDPSTWTNFQDVVDAAILDKYDGIGFQLRGTNLVGFDFDGVLQNGTPDPYVLSILELLPNPYIEITPSGTGLRAFVVYDEPLPPGKRKFDAKKAGVKKHGIEIYSGREGGRYLTLTGNYLKGVGVPQIEDLSIPYFLISKFADEHFKRMWMGDASDYENDDSRLDLALLGALVRAFDGNTDEAVRFFNASIPGHREKWIKRDDYVERTMRKAAERIANSNGDVDDRKPLEFKKPKIESATAYDYVLNPQLDSGQFEGWFPLGSPSLIGGSSGSGKTTFMVDLCVSQLNGQPFYGHPATQRPYLVLMTDRGKFSHERTMRRLGFSADQVPIQFLPMVLDDDASQEILNRIEEAEPAPQLIFIEGIDMLVSDPNKIDIVAPFLREIQEIATHFHCAIVGSTGAPKVKPKEGYTAKRDTIFGSAVWGRMVETVVTIQFPDGDDTVDQRIISVLPRNAKAEKFETEFQNGHLVIAPFSRVEPEDASIKKLRQNQDAQTRAEMFIERYLNENGGCALQSDVMHEAKWGERIGENSLRDGAASLRQRGIIVMKKAEGRKSIWQLTREAQEKYV